MMQMTDVIIVAEPELPVLDSSIQLPVSRMLVNLPGKYSLRKAILTSLYQLANIV